MFNVCPGCGEYTVEKAIEADGPFAVCPRCGHRQRFVQLPLFLITGASGVGKTAVGLHLVGRLPECVVLESDILWRSEFATPEDDYRSYRDLWLRVAKNVGQGGRPVVLCGTAVPAQFEACPERRYFASLHYLALVCDDDVLAARLRARPAWRQTDTTEFIASMTRFNQWFKEHAATTHPPLTLLDTTTIGVEDAAECAADWVRARLALLPRSTGSP